MTDPALMALIRPFAECRALTDVCRDLYGQACFFPVPQAISGAVNRGLLRNVDECKTVNSQAVYTMNFVLTDEGAKWCGVAVSPVERQAKARTLFD